MEPVIEFGKLLIPAAVVLYAMYLVVKNFINRDIQKQQLEIRGRSMETVLPNRLHAYERVCLFLERITPGSLLPRLNNGEYTAKEFSHILNHEIREEYNHNVSQQLYMSEEVWALVMNSMDDLVTTIGEAGKAVTEEASGLDLSKKILELYAAKDPDPIRQALIYLKAEIRQTF